MLEHTELLRPEAPYANTLKVAMLPPATERVRTMCLKWWLAR